MSNIIQLCEERMALSLLGSTPGALIMTIHTNKRILVLVVEDEFLVRTNAAEMIADAGFDVVEAGNADEAIAILEARPEIHVVFTDIQMAGSMDGLKLAHFVRGRWPPIKIIATSGQHVLREGDLPAGGVFLPKPYSFGSISAILRQLTA